MSQQWTDRGISIDIPNEQPNAPVLRVSTEVGSVSSFRLGVEFIAAAEYALLGAGDTTSPIDSPSLDTGREMAHFKPATEGGLVGIQTSFGKLLVDPETGMFTLKDAAGATLAAATAPPVLALEAVPDPAGYITMPVSGSKTGPGATGRRPCLVNGAYDPQVTAGRTGGRTGGRWADGRVGGRLGGRTGGRAGGRAGDRTRVIATGPLRPRPPPPFGTAWPR
jgi:hypothetical protein